MNKLTECLYCGADHWLMDLNATARVKVCQNCGTRVNLSIWESRHAPRSVEHEPDLGGWLGPVAVKTLEDEAKRQHEFNERREAMKISRSLMGI